MSWLGAPLKRQEDPRLLRGQGRYTDDIRLAGLAHVVFLRSRVAHARIIAMDLSRALASPGVVAVISGAQLAESLGPIPVLAQVEGMKLPAHRALAREVIHYYGQPLAVVVAHQRWQADDALHLIDLELEPLPPVVDVEAALAPGAPLVHPQFGDNVAYTWRLPAGDAAGALASAHCVVRQKVVNQRLIPSALETRAVVAEFEAGREELTVWASTQRPHLLRGQLAMALALPESQVRVVAPDVGGGFGSKVNVYGEEIVLGHLARVLGRPLKWTETRRENCTSTNHGRGQVAQVEAAVQADGTISALRCHILSDVGAHHQLLSSAIPPLTGLMLTGAYKIPIVDVTITGVFTNKMATDAYRGAGKPEATFLIERLLDRVAQELGLDPAEVRRRNFIESFPHQSAAGLFYDSGNYGAALDKALQRLDYAHWRQAQLAGRAHGRLLGIGLSSYVEMAGVGPSFIIKGGGWETATVRLDRAGRVTVLTGTSPQGQGTHTTFSQLVAERLGVPPEEVRVLHGDTQVVPYGVGTWGSRGVSVGASALDQALHKLLDKARQLAATMLQCQPDEVTFAEGRFRHGPAAVSLAEVTNFAINALGLPPGMEPGLEATCNFEPPNFTFPSGSHAVVVEVERSTGAWRILKYVAVDDCGKIINPLLVDGQVHGGIAQGLGQVVGEEVIYDAEGRLLSDEFCHYPLVKAPDMPWIETDTVETPSSSNALGVKGVGESGTIGAPAAIVNALVDAFSPYGVTHLDMPVRPEALWRILEGRS